MERVKRSLQRRRGPADLRELLALIAWHEIAQGQGFATVGSASRRRAVAFAASSEGAIHYAAAARRGVLLGLN